MLNKEVDDLRRKILIEKNLLPKNNSSSLFGIENFWIISKSGISIFSLEDTVFSSKNDQDLFGGFISAIVSLSQHLSKSNLTEIKIEKLSLHVQTYKDFFLVSLISSNQDLSLRCLAKLIDLYGEEIKNYVIAIKKEKFFDLRPKFHLLQSNPEIKKEIMITTSYDYISQFIFGIIEIDEFFKKIHTMVLLASQNAMKEFLANLNEYIEIITEVKVNLELIGQLKLTIETLESYLEYMEKKTPDSYNKYIKNLFGVFVQFFSPFD